MREALAIFSPYQPDDLENVIEVVRAIISFPRAQKNVLLLNLNLLFSWRNTALGCILYQDNYMSLCMISLYNFGINTVMVRRLPTNRLARRYRP